MFPIGSQYRQPQRVRQKPSVAHIGFRKSRVLCGEFFGIPIAPRVAGAGLFVKFVIGLAYAISGFVVIHREKRKIERVRTDVDKRTAALLFLVDEHAPGGNGATTDSDSLGVVDFAEVILIGKFFEV